MTRGWPETLVRVLLAMLVATGSLGLPSTYGHRHATGKAPHAHPLQSGLGHAEHHHDGDTGDTHVPEQGGDEHELELATGGEFHLHSVFFGFFLSLPSASALTIGTSGDVATAGFAPGFHTLLTTDRPVRSPAPWPFEWGHGSAVRPFSLKPITRPASPPFPSQEFQAALSVVLRC